MRILTVVGARPQFVKLAPLSAAIATAGHHEYVVHTGQHYDHQMSQVFFDELGIRPPDLNLEIGSGRHGVQTATMLARLEEVMIEQKPDRVIVIGDTNSTLAGALAACKLRIPLGHVEAGLRSYNRDMPEEHNRVLTDHVADILFCPTSLAADNLRREGIERGVHVVGDIMLDALTTFRARSKERSTILARLGLASQRYLLATIHRASTSDDAASLLRVVQALAALEETVVFPVHPRTRSALANLDFTPPSSLRLIEPVGYLDMIALEENARGILTDSGGVQKEAFFLGVSCVTLREETEWRETVEEGWNTLVGRDPARIVQAVRALAPGPRRPSSVYGDGHSAAAMVNLIALS